MQKLKSINTSQIFLFGIISIFFLGVALRMHQLGSYPEHNYTADEYAWTWSGMTLLSEGQPKAWSWLKAYPNGDLVEWKDNPYKLVQPWLDHPPIYSLFMGSWMSAGGFSEDIFSVSLSYMRASSVVLFIVCFWLFYLILSKLKNNTLSFWALLVFATTPIMVAYSKLVLSENLLVIFFLLAHFFFLRLKDRIGKLDLTAFLACLTICPLIKVAGVSIAGYFIFASLLLNKNRLLIYSSLSLISGILLYLLYGFLIDWNLFLKVLSAHAERFANFNNVFDLLVNYRALYNNSDALYLLSAFYLFVDRKEASITTKLFGLFMLVYTIIMVVLVPGEGAYDWYQIPLYPALALGVACFLNEMIKKDSQLMFWCWYALCTPAMFNFLQMYFNYPVSILKISYVVLTACVFGLFWLNRLFDKRNTYIILIIVILQFLANILTVFLFEP